MFFELQHGIYQDAKKNVYQVTKVKNDKGEVVEIHKPIVESEIDLAKTFGSTKFKLISEQEAKRLQADQPRASGETAEPSTSPDADIKTDVAVAVEEGSKDIAPPQAPLNKPIGRDLTNNFPIAAKANMKVYYKPGTGYLVVDNATGDLLTTDEPLLKSEVGDFIKEYMEK